MSDLSYGSIAPLIANQQQSGRSMRFVFRCPASNTSVNASYMFDHDPGVGSKVAAAAQRSIWYTVRREVGYAIRSAFGYNMFGRVASDMATAAMSASTSGRSTAAQYSDEEKQIAAVEAFRSVASQFAWDQKGGRWVSRKVLQTTMSPFERQIAEFPIEHPYDKHILSRMLVEAATADGRLGEEEESFLIEFLEDESVEQIAQRPTLTEAELGECSPGGVRETMLLLASVLALSDEQLEATEKQKLDHFATGLGITGPRRFDVAKKAQTFILDQAMEKMFEWGGHDETARAELLKLADRIGMDRRSAAVAEAQFQKRRGAAAQGR